MVRLLVTMGDPAGVGPEILLVSLAHLPPGTYPTVVGDRSFLESMAQRLKVRVPWKRVCWADVPMRDRIRPGKVQAAAGRAALAFLEEAVRRLKRGEADALVTGPVSKEAIARAGIPWRGQTEYLAGRFHRPTTMMFVTGSFRVSLITTHWAIRKVPSRLRQAEVVRALRQTGEALRSDFGISKPRIGLAALNPHGGEGGLFGGEEREILRPAVRRSGSGVVGPLSADSLIQQAALGRFDAVVAVYHDQALIPVKLLGWKRAVHLTLGLPFVRSSPVHGTAFDLVGQRKANPSSLQAAIRLAVDLTRRHGRRPRD